MTARGNARAIDVTTIAVSLIAIGVWFFLGWNGYIMHAGHWILAALPIVLSAGTYGTVRLALRGPRWRAFVPAATVVALHVFIIRDFMPSASVAGMALPLETILRNTSVSILSLLSIILVLLSLVIPHERAAA